MNVRIHPHAMTRCLERGAIEPEVIDTVLTGQPFPAKYGRFGFRKQFTFNAIWNNHFYETKQIEAYAIKENGWLVITVIVKYY